MARQEDPPIRSVACAFAVFELKGTAVVPEGFQAKYKVSCRKECPANNQIVCAPGPKREVAKINAVLVAEDKVRQVYDARNR